MLKKFLINHYICVCVIYSPLTCNRRSDTFLLYQEVTVRSCIFVLQCAVKNLALNPLLGILSYFIMENSCLERQAFCNTDRHSAQCFLYLGQVLPRHL